MKKSKSVQLDIEIFYELCSYFLDNEEIDLKSVKDALQTKRDALQRHTLYSLSKNQQLDNETREHFRQEYLDSKGIPKSFRYEVKHEDD